MNQAIILAGGKGKRMGGDYPKTMTEIGGKAIIFRILDSLKEICPKPTIIVGFGADIVKKAVGERAGYVFQDTQQGTGHAVLCAKEQLEKENLDSIIVIPGDHPLVNGRTIAEMISLHQREGSAITLSYLRVPDYRDRFELFQSFGRILRDEEGRIAGIGEVKDISEAEKKIREVNTSYYCFNAGWLWRNIGLLKPDNAARELYLTDLVRLAVSQKAGVSGFQIENPEEGMGVNTPEEKRLVEGIILANTRKC